MRRILAALIVLCLSVTGQAFGEGWPWMPDGNGGVKPAGDKPISAPSVVIGGNEALTWVPAAHDFANATARDAYFDGTPNAAVDDICHLQDTGFIQRCVVAGSPGTWVNITALTKGPAGDASSDDQTASEVSVADAGELTDQTDVEAYLAENRAAIDALETVDNWTEAENTAAAYLNATAADLLYAAIGHDHSGVYLESETDPNALLTAGTDNVKDTHLDWGTGAGQVSAGDIPIADATSQFTGTTVEAALDELHDNIEGLGGGHDALTLGASLSSIFSLTGQELGLTAWPTFNQNTTGTAAGLTSQYIDWNSGSGGTSIANKPTIPTASSLSVDDLITLSGVAGGAQNLGTFTGSTITDNQTIKAALQLLETAVEGIEVGGLADIDDLPGDTVDDDLIDAALMPAATNAAPGHATAAQITALEAIDTAEERQDEAGGMWTGNTETGITVTYQDADGTIDAVVSITTGQIAAATLVTEAEGIGSNDNDTTIPTSAAVKDYADSVAGSPTNVTPVDTADENATFYPLMVDGATGTQATETDGGLSYNPSTNILTAGGYASNAADGLHYGEEINTENITATATAGRRAYGPVAGDATSRHRIADGTDWNNYFIDKEAIDSEVELEALLGFSITVPSELGTLNAVTPGTGVATALAVNVGSAGAPVINGGALGTPSGGTLTNCTGLPTSGITDGDKGDVTNASGTITIDDNVVDYAATSGSYKSLTPLTGDADDFDDNFTGANLYGGTYIANGTGTCILPAVTAGMNFTIITLGDIAIAVDPNANDRIIHPSTGTESDGEAITNLSTGGDMVVCQYESANGWLCVSNGWSAAN